MSSDDDNTDLHRVRTVVRELTYRFPNPTTGKGMIGLLEQAWTATPAMLAARATVDGGHGGKPGSRPPTRLDLWSHVQTTLDAAREEAEDLGFYVATDRAEVALSRIPKLIEATYAVDCRTCDKCVTGTGGCICRHRTVTRRIDVCHSTLRTALGWQEPRVDWTEVECPGCKRVGKVSVRIAEAKVWCRHDGCDWRSHGAIAILALA